MNSSPDRGSFQKRGIVRRAEQGETSAEHAEEMLEFYDSIDKMKAETQAKEEWKENNLEYDLRSTQWICDKAKASEGYAQNIYAALCNRDWQKNDVWPLLANKTWSCSWRYAGGIVADMLEEGDYIDWYCSGINGDWSDEEFQNATKEDQEKYLYMKNNFVSESVITDEIREDFFKLGWIPVDDYEE